MMNAWTYSAYGSASELAMQQVPKPIPQATQVLVKVAATCINKADQIILSGTPFAVRLATGGITKPKLNTIIGSDFAGTIEAIGSKVTSFHVGDSVYGQIDFPTGQGACAEYVCLNETDAIALKPTNFTFEEAASLPLAAQTALQAIQSDANVQSGQNVLINGASGGVGTFAIQIAKALGARVTAVCSEKNADAARRYGADTVIQYNKEDFVVTASKDHHVLIDLVGNHSLKEFRSVMTRDGTYVSVGGPPETFMSRIFALLFLKPFASQRLALSMQKPSKDLLQTLTQLAEKDQLVAPITARFDFNHANDAFRHFEAGHAQGKIVITMQ